jgi:hypothetical protein
MNLSQSETAKHHHTPVSLPTLLGITSGSAGSSIFAATYLIEGVTRPGYNTWQQLISALSLGSAS